MARVGFVGLGVMGAPMAGHLLRAGHELTVWSRKPEKSEALGNQGAHVASSLTDLGSKCEAVMLCVTRTEDVQECLSDLTVAASPGTLFVDHSTILPKAAKQLYKQLGEKGFHFVDAPITGGSMGALKGQLTIFCGGDEATVSAAEPLLSAYAKRIERVGGPGSGQMMKMANQIAVGGALLALCESLAFAKKAGLDLAQARDLLSSGAAGSWAFDNYGPKIIAQDWSPGFTIVNQTKDFDYCLESANDLGAVLPGTQMVDGFLKEMIEDGAGEETTAALYKKLLALGEA